MNAVEIDGAAKRYRNGWGLIECSFRVPTGSVVALVGPNGAGKTTLMNLLVGLALPTKGRISVLDGELPGSKFALDRVAFVAQDAPLYRHLSVDDTLRFARYLNRRWDEQFAHSRLSELSIPMKAKVGKLSGGQRAQVALTVALARHPDLLVLDEPMARLDPVARHEFAAQLMEETTSRGTSIVVSSHAVMELERIADYLVLLSDGRLRLVGEIDDLIAAHVVLTGPASSERELWSKFETMYAVRGGSQVHVLARSRAPGIVNTPRGWSADEVGLEELVLGYLRTFAASRDAADVDTGSVGTLVALG